MLDASMQMKYNIGIRDIESYRFGALLSGLLIDDKTPFGYVCMVRKYKGELKDTNKHLHKKYSQDKAKFSLKLTNEDIINNIARFKNQAKAFREV